MPWPNVRFGNYKESAKDQGKDRMNKLTLEQKEKEEKARSASAISRFVGRRDSSRLECFRPVERRGLLDVLLFKVGNVAIRKKTCKAEQD